MALVVVARCTQRYKLLFVVATIAQWSRVVQLQSVVRVPGIATLCALVLMLSEDGCAAKGGDLAPIVFTRAMTTACV